jgi:NAD(P)-dependent dehydrogenase (short-subunit alcohol dehydrogenase family)
MSRKHKPINEQVIVITGASSGIGLATAQAAAREGAKLVLASRSGSALERIAGGLCAAGADAIAVTCDVGDRKQVDRLARAAVDRYGRIDTWINDAGVSIFGRLDEATEEDSRRLFETNFWGVYYGSLAALPHLKNSGGVLINIGSEVSETGVALQGMYSASKHAVKGLTDALRVEIEDLDESPVSIVLVQPTAVDTPFAQHARNYLMEEARSSSPTVDPERVAEAILECAVKPPRYRKVGSASKISTTAAKIAPGLGERMSGAPYGRLHTQVTARDREGALHRPCEQSRVVGQTHGLHIEESA